MSKLNSRRGENVRLKTWREEEQTYLQKGRKIGRGTDLYVNRKDREVEVEET